MKPFRFKQFSILQNADVFRVGTDAMLLGAFASIENVSSVLEIGVGTGVVSLMIAQRNSTAEILAIDINPAAVELAENNFKNSPFPERLSVSLHDVKDFRPLKKFDLIICNPPFFEVNDSVKDVLARQQAELNFEQLILQSKLLLSNSGNLSIIIPSEASSKIEELAFNQSLFLNRKINVYGIEGGVLKRNILEFSPTQKQLKIVDFTIEKSPRKYSDAYLELTKEFHVFSKEE